MARTNQPKAQKPAPVIARRLFDRVIDCLYEYDLGQELPQRWPAGVRIAIEASRKRIGAGQLQARYLRIMRARHAR